MLAFALTLVAGLSTGIGGLFTFLYKKTNIKLLSVVLGFSAGVMIYVSFVELFSEAQKHLISSLGKVSGTWLTVLGFFGGMLLIAVIDKLIPSYENPHETKKVEDISLCNINQKKLLRTVMMSTIAITIHNFPEGMATFAATIKQPSLGVAIAIAIAIHNIPEGIAVAIPAYCATGSRLKAIGLSFAAGLSEPFGALVGYLILLPFLNDTVLGLLFAAVAGIMVFISLDELLPTAREYGEHHLSMYGLVCGMALIAGSLILFM
jgi:ZIP family zinc transporter